MRPAKRAPAVGRQQHRGLFGALALGLCTTVAASCGADDRAAELPVIAVKRQTFTRVVSAEGYLRPVHSTPVGLPMFLVLGSCRIAWLEADGSTVKKGDLLVRFDDEDLKLRLQESEAQGTISGSEREKELVAQRTDTKSRQRDILASERDLRFQRDFLPSDTEIFSQDKIIEGQATEQLQETKLAIARQSEQVGRRLARNRLGLTEVKLSRSQEDIRRTKDGLKTLEITAAHEGVFTLERDDSGAVSHVGDTAWRGQTLGKVAKVEQLEAEVFVLEAEATGLVEGRRAQVYLQSQPGRPFAARIKRVAKVAKTTQPESPTQYFGVTLALDSAAAGLMKPEQRVRADLFLSEQEALVLPRTALFESDGHSVSYRRQTDGSFRAVTVQVGQSTAGLLTIESGLREGEVVALRDPDHSANRPR